MRDGEAHLTVGHDDTRRRILEAAGPLFAEKGYEATNVREITTRAGANQASINYHFGSKEKLYVEAVRYAGSNCDQAFPMPQPPADATPEQQLRGFITVMLHRMLDPNVPPWHRQLIMRELAEPRHGACEAFVQAFIRPSFDMLLGVLRRLVPADVSAERLNLLGGSIVGQCLHYHHCRHVIRELVGEREHAGYDIDKLADHIFTFSLAALRGLFPHDHHHHPDHEVEGRKR